MSSVLYSSKFDTIHSLASMYDNSVEFYQPNSKSNYEVDKLVQPNSKSDYKADKLILTGFLNNSIINHKIVNKQNSSNRSDKIISIIPKILTSIFCGIMCTSAYFIFPEPFNYISTLAMSGPLFASIIRLLFTKNV